MKYQKPATERVRLIARMVINLSTCGCQQGD